MCTFSLPVRHVERTRIFARPVGGGRQALAYAMNVELDQRLAMVLPLPVPRAAADDAVSFVDLSSYAGLFDDLESAFPQPTLAAARGDFGFAAPQASPTLEVHEVGDFEASLVPSRADFARLDARFRLPESLWGSLRRYDDWGFAVFKLQPKRGRPGLGTRRQSVHPMAFVFPSREPEALFFPTVHVHDGRLPVQADFDHDLYAQVDGLLGATLAWERAPEPLEASVDVARSRGVAGEGALFRGLLSGELPNDDVWLRAPEGLELAELCGSGRHHHFELRAESAFVAHGGRLTHREWQATARRRMPALRAAILAWLAKVEAERAGSWGLCDYDEGLPPHFFNGPKLMGGSSWQSSAEPGCGQPDRLDLSPWSRRFEKQRVELAFRALPSEDKATRIRAELIEALDAALR